MFSCNSPIRSSPTASRASDWLAVALPMHDQAVPERVDGAHPPSRHPIPGSGHASADRSAPARKHRHPGVESPRTGRALRRRAIPARTGARRRSAVDLARCRRRGVPSVSHSTAGSKSSTPKSPPPATELLDRRPISDVLRRSPAQYLPGDSGGGGRTPTRPGSRKTAGVADGARQGEEVPKSLSESRSPCLIRRWRGARPGGPVRLHRPQPHRQTGPRPNDPGGADGFQGPGSPLARRILAARTLGSCRRRPTPEFAWWTCRRRSPNCSASSATRSQQPGQRRFPKRLLAATEARPLRYLAARARLPGLLVRRGKSSTRSPASLAERAGRRSLRFSAGRRESGASTGDRQFWRIRTDSVLFGGRCPFAVRVASDAP